MEFRNRWNWLHWRNWFPNVQHRGIGWLLFDSKFTSSHDRFRPCLRVSSGGLFRVPDCFWEWGGLKKFGRKSIIFRRKSIFSQKVWAYLFQNIRQVGIFWIIFHKNKIESYGFHRWKEQIKTHWVTYAKVFPMLSEFFIFNFLKKNVGKTFF